MNDRSVSSKEYAATAYRIVRYGFRLTRFVFQTYPLIAYLRYLRPDPTVRGKVTIITATYNRPQALREAISHVRAQTYQDWEQIIVSDGRDDRVPALVAEVGDPRIRCTHTHRFPTSGYYQKNYGLKYATGEFVLFFDDDNIIYPHCLQTMVSGFSSDDIGYVICPIKYGERRRGDRDVITEKRPKPGFRYTEIDQLNYMIRRRLIEQAWGLSMQGSGDFLLIDKMTRMTRGAYLDEIIGFHT